MPRMIEDCTLLDYVVQAILGLLISVLLTLVAHILRNYQRTGGELAESALAGFAGGVLGTFILCIGGLS